MPDVAQFMTKQGRRNADPKSSMHSFELVLTVLVFFGIGFWLDTLFETRPLLVLVLGAIGAIGAGTSAYFRYMSASASEDEGKVWGRETTHKSIDVPQEDNSVEVPRGYGSND